MPARNKQIIRAIGMITHLNNDPDDGARIKAALVGPLDAILKADLTANGQKNFIQAITAHSVFWSKPPFGVDTRLPTETVDNDFLEDKPADFKAIKQQAAEQRVLLGVQKINDEDVLLGILQNNSDALRAYIGSKPQLGQLDAIPGWKPAPTPLLAAPPPSKDILSDAILVDIQKSAAELLLAKRIAATTDNALLHALIVADNPSPATFEALKKLGVPYDLKPVPVDLVKAAKDLFIKQAYPVASSTLALPVLKGHLEGTDDAFKAHMQAVLVIPLIDISPEQIQTARSELANNYLQRKLSDAALLVKAADINAIKDVDTMVAFIKKAPLSETHANITGAITAENLTSLKTTMVNNVIGKLTVAQIGALTKLSAAKNAGEVTAALDKIGIKPTAWINDKAVEKIIDASAKKLEAVRSEQMARITFKTTPIDQLINLAKITKLDDFRSKFGTTGGWIDTPQMLQLQKKACNRALEIRVADLSALGPQQHSALIDVLQRLPVKKQMQLLESNNPTLGHLLKASDPVKVAHYLGEDVKLDPILHADVGQLISAVVAENKRVESFQKVQNAEFSAVLARFGFPPIAIDHPKIPPLSSTQIQALNEKLSKITEADLNNFAKLKELAAVIMEPPHTQDTRNALATHIADNKSDILAQAKVNKPLYDMYADRAPVGKAVLDVLLKLKVDVDYGADKDKFVAALRTVLDKHHNKVEDFIAELCKSPSIVSLSSSGVLKEALKKEFSQGEFSKIANEWKKQLLQDPNASAVQKMGILTSIINTMKDIKPLMKPAESLDALAKTEFSGFAYDAHTMEGDPAGKKKVYMERLTNATVALDRLLRAQGELKQCMAVLPANSPDANIKKIHAELKKDLDLLEINIQKYKDGQQKLISTIKDIDRIMHNKEHYLYTADDIVHHELSDTQLASLKTGVNVSISVGGSDVATKVKLEEGKKAHLFTVTDSSIPNKATVGQFTQTFGETSRSHVNSDGTVSKRPNIKVEMISPPTVVGSAGGAAPDGAQVKMYMNMALAMIVANGGKPPSKEHPYRLKGGTDAQMEGLWTALHIICKEKYGYSHSKFMESVKIQTGGFDPKNVMNPGRTRWSEPSFKETSQYVKIFSKAETKNARDDKLEDAQAIVDQAKATKTAISSGTGALQSYKTQMSSGRTTEALQKASELRAKEGVVAPDPKPSELRHS